MVKAQKWQGQGLLSVLKRPLYHACTTQRACVSRVECLFSFLATHTEYE